MAQQFNHCLFVFRQDLRIQDNAGLFHSHILAKKVTPVFILDETILQGFPENDGRMDFLYSALYKLDTQLRDQGSQLFVYQGKSTEILPQLCKKLDVDIITRNKSYGKNSYSRDNTIKKRADDNALTTKQYADYLLVEPSQVIQMKVFTPFYKRWLGKPKRWKVHTINAMKPVHQNAGNHNNYIDPATRKNIQHPHRSVNTVDRLITSLPIPAYDDRRNIPSDQGGTSKASPYLAFGLVSARQLLQSAVGPSTPGVSINNDIITMDKKVFKNSYVSELAWREFWHHVAHYFPETRSVEFLEKYRSIKRVNNKDRFEAWKSGNTGYPIVDAAMRQLREEHWMHGRCRMIVASFLTKDLLIDRKRGEEHFKNYLLDYDINVNIGNRQRSASVGADPKPLRIFNPILQSKRFDPDGTYIKKWLPELATEPLAAIHDPIKYALRYTPTIVNHYETSKLAKKMYYGEPITL